MSDNLDDLINKGEIEEAYKTKVFDELAKIAELKTGDSYLDDFISLRNKYFDSSVLKYKQLWKKTVQLKHLDKSGIISLFTKHLNDFPNLSNGHNQAVFNVKFLENGK